MGVYVISGGPGTGKTTLINELSKEFRVLPEGARYVGENDSRFKGKKMKDFDMPEFQRAIFEFQKKYIEGLDRTNGETVFSDRGLGDTLAYDKVHNLEPAEEVVNYAKKFRYDLIFILEQLNFYEKDDFRHEEEEFAKKAHRIIIETHEQLGYNPVFVQFMPIEDRVSFIKSKVLSFK